MGPSVAHVHTHSRSALIHPATALASAITSISVSHHLFKSLLHPRGEFVHAIGAVANVCVCACACVCVCLCTYIRAGAHSSALAPVPAHKQVTNQPPPLEHFNVFLADPLLPAIVQQRQCSTYCSDFCFLLDLAWLSLCGASSVDGMGWDGMGWEWRYLVVSTPTLRARTCGCCICCRLSMGKRAPFARRQTCGFRRMPRPSVQGTSGTALSLHTSCAAFSLVLAHASRICLAPNAAVHLHLLAYVWMLVCPPPRW